MSDTTAWIIVGCLFAATYIAGLATAPLIRQITGAWPPLWWTKLRNRP